MTEEKKTTLKAVYYTEQNPQFPKDPKKRIVLQSLSDPENGLRAAEIVIGHHIDTVPEKDLTQEEIKSLTTKDGLRIFPSDKTGFHILTKTFEKGEAKKLGELLLEARNEKFRKKVHSIVEEHRPAMELKKRYDSERMFQ